MTFHITWTAHSHGESIPKFLEHHAAAEKHTANSPRLNLGPDIKVLSSYHVDPALGKPMGFVVAEASGEDVIHAVAKEWPSVHVDIVAVLTDDEVVPVLKSMV